MFISLFLCYAELYLFIFFQRLKADFLESFCGIPENTNLSFCKVSAVMSDLEVRFTQYEAIQTTTHYFAFPFAVLIEAIKVIRISRQRFSRRSYPGLLMILVLVRNVHLNHNRYHYQNV